LSQDIPPENAVLSSLIENINTTAVDYFSRAYLFAKHLIIINDQIHYIAMGFVLPEISESCFL